MTKESLRTIVQKLHAANVRYFVVGGLAVVAHGYLRATVDVDFMIDLSESNTARMLDVLQSLGYVPKASMSLTAFADPVVRNRLAQDGNFVFRLRSAIHEKTDIDLIIDSACDFEQMFERRVEFQVDDAISLSVCCYEDLVESKRRANRAVDAIDLQHLEKARGSPSEAELHDPWFSCTFECNELQQLHETAAWPFADKVAQLEEMHEIARVFQGNRRKNGGGHTIRASGLIEDV
jgi:hypothetical protein